MGYPINKMAQIYSKITNTKIEEEILFFLMLKIYVYDRMFNKINPVRDFS